MCFKKINDLDSLRLDLINSHQNFEFICNSQLEYQKQSAL